jgi:hypothetical protein
VRVRAPAFLFALLIMFLVVAFELATLGFLQGMAEESAGTESPQGLGAVYLALLDGILLLTTIVFGVGHLRPDGLIARIASILWLVVSFFGILGSLLLALFAFQAIMLMLALLMAAPFGTLAYLALFAHFPADDAVKALSFLLVLKLAFVVMLAITDIGYLKNKPLMLMAGLSIGATWLTSFLIAWPPGFLASITDAVGALVTAIIALVMLILILVGSILGLLKALRVRMGRRQV